MCSPLHQPDGPLSAGPTASRRTVLRATGLTGAATAAAAAWACRRHARRRPCPVRTPLTTLPVGVPTPTAPDSRSSSCRTPSTSSTAPASTPSPSRPRCATSSTTGATRTSSSCPTSATSPSTARAAEFGPLSEAFRLLDRRRVGYSVLAGNHDIDSSTDDQRGRTPYLDAFGPQRFCAGCPPSAAPRPTATTRTTSSAPPAASGWSSPWTGGLSAAWLRLGQGRHRQAPEDAGHPHHARARVRRRVRRRGRVLRRTASGCGTS